MLFITFNDLMAKYQGLRIGLGIGLGILLVCVAVACYYGFKRFRKKMNDKPSSFQKNNDYIVYFIHLFWIGSFLLCIGGAIVAFAIGFTAIAS